MQYIIDSNFWINCNRNYPSDIFPALWCNLKKLILKDEIIIHESISNELSKKDDDLYKWVKSFAASKIMMTSIDALDIYLEIIDWAKKSELYSSQAIEQLKMADNADAVICAECCANDFTVVTDETFRNSPNKVKIPNICKAFSVDCISNFDFMRKYGFKF